MPAVLMSLQLQGCLLREKHLTDLKNQAYIGNSVYKHLRILEADVFEQSVTRT